MIDLENDYDYVFWMGAIVYFAASVLFWVGRKGDVGYVFYAQFVAGTCIFVGSKIGRTFLGLEAE